MKIGGYEVVAYNYMFTLDEWIWGAKASNWEVISVAHLGSEPGDRFRT